MELGLPVSSSSAWVSWAFGFLVFGLAMSADFCCFAPGCVGCVAPASSAEYHNVRFEKTIRNKPRHLRSRHRNRHHQESGTLVSPGPTPGLAALRLPLPILAALQLPPVLRCPPALCCLRHRALIGSSFWRHVA